MYKGQPPQCFFLTDDFGEIEVVGIEYFVVCDASRYYIIMLRLFSYPAKGHVVKPLFVVRDKLLSGESVQPFVQFILVYVCLPTLKSKPPGILPCLLLK